jgi:hypothetical protein
MAFPTIPTIGNGRLLSQNQNNTTAARTFPSLSSLTKNSGDLLIAVAVAYERSAASATFGSWGGGFTELADIDGGATTMAVGIATKTSTGSETGTFTVTQAATVTGHCALFLMSIPGWLALSPAEVTALAVGTAAAANPGALDPSGWGTTDTLWIAVAGNGETNTGGSWTGLGTPTPPTNYGSENSPGIGTDAVGGIHAAVAFRQNATGSEDVGTWGGQDVSNARNCALLIAVRGVKPISVSLTPATETDSAGVLPVIMGAAAETDSAVALIYNVTFVDVSPALETDLANSIVPLQPLPATEASAAQPLSYALAGGENISPALETDAAQAVTFTKPIFKSITETAETDAAVALVVTKPIFKSVAEASESDTAVSLRVALMTAAETDAAQTLTAAKQVTLATAAETDLANQIVALQPLPALETDTAQTLTVQGGGINLTVATETDSVQAVTKSKAVTLPEVEATPPLPYNTVTIGDTSTAVALTVSGPTGVDITPAIETDSGQTVDKDKAVALTLSVETDVAQAANIDKLVTVALVVEADSVQTVDKDKALTVQLAAETDSAQAVTYSQAGAYSISPATETDTAGAFPVRQISAATETDAAGTVAFTKPILKTVVLTAETDSAQTLTYAQASDYSLTLASETDTAGSLRAPRLTQAAETDAALTLTYSQAGAYSIAPAVETDSAQTLVVPQTIQINTAGDASVAVAITNASLVTLTTAVETSTVPALTVHKTVTLTLAGETDAAVGLAFGGAYDILHASETDTATALRYAAMPPSGTLHHMPAGRIVRSRTGRVSRPKQGVLS